MVGVSDIVTRVVDGERPPMPTTASGCPERMQRPIKWCWNQNPEDRPEFPEVVDELIAITDETPETKYSEQHASTSADALDQLFHK